MPVDKAKDQKNATDQSKEKLETEAPLGERDEVKKAEDRTRDLQEKNTGLPGKNQGEE